MTRIARISRNIMLAAGVLSLAVSLTRVVQAHAPAAEGCGASQSQYAHELAVMASAATAVSASGPGATPAVRLDLERRYAINLREQRALKFRAAPGRHSQSAKARGGVFAFQTEHAGRYRVSLTSRHWIDVLDGDAVIESAAHFGPGCSLVHKIVEFDLPAGREITLQLSGREDAIVGLAVTAVPVAVAVVRNSR
jgi:hypothetical protein